MTARSFARMRRLTPVSVPSLPRPGAWRAFSRRTLEIAGVTGVLLRFYRAGVLSLDSATGWPLFIAALVVGALLACGALTWHLSNFPLKRWPARVAAFLAVEVAAEWGTSSLLIALHREPLGSGLADWADWWALAGNTLVERCLVLGGYAGLLAVATWLVMRRRLA
jgi:hypothetical protein